MPNFEFKKDCVSTTALNLALNSIVIVDDDDDDPGRKDFVLWYLRQFGVKRLRREKLLWTLQSLLRGITLPMHVN